jgi:hypothetical protein
VPKHERQKIKIGLQQLLKAICHDKSQVNKYSVSKQVLYNHETEDNIFNITHYLRKLFTEQAAIFIIHTFDR